jgi:hypothetical protein
MATRSRAAFAKPLKQLCAALANDQVRRTTKEKNRLVFSRYADRGDWAN